MVALCATLSGKAQLRYVDNSFRSTNAADVQASANNIGKTNMTNALTDFEKTHDGDGYRGQIRIVFKNLSNEDVRDKVTIGVNPGYAGKPSYVDNPVENRLECWVQVDPDKQLTLDVSIDGIGSVRIPGLEVKGKQSYFLEVESDETVAITFNSTVDGTKVWLDNVLLGTCGATTNVSNGKTYLGKHHVKAQAPSGKSIEQDIEVSKKNTHFPLDLQNYYQVDFRSNEDNVAVYENGKMIATVPSSVKVAEGPHSFVVRKPGYDDVQHNVNISGPGIQKLDIYKTKTIDFYSLQNNSDFSGATLYIDNEKKGTTPMSLTLPYNKYRVKMSYYGREKSGSLVVDDKTSSTYRLTIPNSGHSRFNPFGIDYNKHTIGLTAAWVQKWYNCSYGGESFPSTYFTIDDGHMQGVQVGLPIQPSFGYGLGLNTGLYFEAYFESDSSANLTEYCLYMPVDLMFRVPFTEDFSVYINGGIGIDWSIGIDISADGYDTYSLDYSEAGPSHFNFSAEFGGGLQYKHVQLGVQYQMGLNNNTNIVYNDEVELNVKLRKFAVQLTYLF